MDIESIGKLLGGVLTGGAVGNIAAALAEGFKLANSLREPDPIKRAKARRDYYLSLLKLIKEVQNADSKDVSVLVNTFTDLLNE
jgi:gas vesicle protein